jgi:hypothetical protein
MAVDLYIPQLFSHHPFEQGVGYMGLSGGDRIGKAMAVLYNPVVVYHRGLVGMYMRIQYDITFYSPFPASKSLILEFNIPPKLRPHTFPVPAIAKCPLITLTS